MLGLAVRMEAGLRGGGLGMAPPLSRRPRFRRLPRSAEPPCKKNAKNKVLTCSTKRPPATRFGGP